MKYRFILTYQATDSETTSTRTCFPLHSDDLAISIDREQDEWYYTRNLDGKMVFTGDDYAWIMGCEFDGTFTLNIQESHDNGRNWYDYFSGTFSRASLEIDEDNHTATLNGLKEGITDLIKNGAKEDYDLMKLIPDSEAKTVQGQVPPALAIVDWINSTIGFSDMYCGGPSIGGGVIGSGWNIWQNIDSTPQWNLIGLFAEAKVTMRDHNSPAEGRYSAELLYQSQYSTGGSVVGPVGSLRNNNYYWLAFSIGVDASYTDKLRFYATTEIYDNHGVAVPNTTGITQIAEIATNKFEGYLIPTSVTFTASEPFAYEKIEIYFHYIRAALLTSYYNPSTQYTNDIDTGDYYKGMQSFYRSEFTTAITRRTSDQPNGHRMVPGSSDYGGIPQYFAPPDDNDEWIPLAENNWKYASMWYKITPSVDNGLLDPTKIGSFQWSRCWTIECCIMHLLKRITNDKVVFSESTDYSQFLYGNPNPVQDHEPFQWLVTQKSNVMRPTAGGASRCPVRLEWFFELLHNAFNCYYWLEKRNDGKYDFHIEHVEYFRRGGTYDTNSEVSAQFDLTVLKPTRNFIRNGIAAKHYADQTNRYTFDLDNMVEKYTYSWQGDGGSDDFKGNPMYFKAGWIEKGSSEDHQVDNIFADLGWLMLNAGTATESSKNYDGLFIFGGYQRFAALQWLSPHNVGSWTENGHPKGQYLVLDRGTAFRTRCYAWMTIPAGEVVILKYERVTDPISIAVKTITGTGKPQLLAVEEHRAFDSIYRLMIQFPAEYADVTIHRIHADGGNVFRVPNVADLLRDGNDLQNGVLAWPWLQNEYLHYDIPAAKWTYLKDDYTDNPNLVWESDGTIKMVKKQTLAVVPVPDASAEDAIMGIMGVKTGLGTGIIDSAKVNLSSRDAEMTIIYDINPQNNQ